MNKYAKIFVVVIVFAFLSDAITFGIMALLKGMTAEANPIKVIFGDGAIFFAIGISFVAAFLLYFLIKNADTKFRKGLVAILAANVVYAKILASIANLYFALFVEVKDVYLPNELLASYFLTMIFILISPLAFNLLFYWIWWNWFKKPTAGRIYYA